MAGYKKLIAAAFLVGSAWIGASAIAAIKNSPSDLTGQTGAASEFGSLTAEGPNDGHQRTRYEFSRLQSFSEWWQLPVLLTVCTVVLAFVAYMYRRDSVELKPIVGVLLAMLRLGAFGGVLLMFSDLERHTETKVIKNSRVVLLVDTSLSMSRTDTNSSMPGQGNATGIAVGTSVGQRRIDQVTNAFTDGKLLDTLRQTHDVETVRFDSDVRRVVTLPKLAPTADNTTAPPKENESTTAASDKVDWQKQLEPQGSETRIGQAIRQIINDERGVPLSGIVLFSDGGQNAGVAVSAAVKAAQEAKVPVDVVGLGSAVRPANVRVSDLVAPARAYPGDSFQVTGYLQSQGLSGRTVTVELSVASAEKGQGGNAAPSIQKTERVTLGGDSETIPVRFDIPGIDIAGRRVVQLRIKPIVEDKDPGDNQREVDVDIVDRKNRVLLFAGGPAREYQFVRNMLRRSELAKSGDMIVDVLLQSAGDGVSQDANQILSEFPHTMKELAQYDTIIAFDPDWRELDPQQIELMEKWVGEESGGLIAIAGPIYTDAWVQAPEMATVRKLYPVEFNRRLALLEDSHYGSQQPWPLDFTREGLEAEFLWLDSSAATSREVWDSFSGVFGYYRVRGPKPGATTYANYSDPEAAVGDQKPVYFAGQFYGSGRVFYMGSGEMWRLREMDERYFNSFYIKLIRHVSQGRLLRGSPLGNLLVDRERYVVGNTVVVRAQLTNPQRQPLDAPQVTLKVTQRDGAPMSVTLAADPARKGMYSGQFTATQEGECRLDLLHPDSPDEPLTRRLQVFMPKLEQEKPERNDAVLKELADGTGGQLYLGIPAALVTDGDKALSKQLEDKTQEIYVAGQKDRKWEEDWMHCLLGVIAGCLCVEWVIRRLCKLA
jgi:hypothetical protein